MIALKGRMNQKEVEAEQDITILDLALKHKVDFGFSCTKGTCARCRCFIQEGSALLSKPTEEELDRLEPEEIEQGYRLSCQATIKAVGSISVVHKPYF